MRPEQFPYTCQTGWIYDSGDYPRDAAQGAGNCAATSDCGASRPNGPAASSWVSASRFFTEAVGAGPRKHMDILGLGMNDGVDCASTRPARRCSRISVQTQGQGHETTFAQIVAEELGLSPEDIEVVHGDTDTDAVRARHLRVPFDPGVRRGHRDRRPQGARPGPDRGRGHARGGPADLEWEKGRWFVSGDPEQGATIAEIALAAHSDWSCRTAWRGTSTRAASTTRRT